MSQEQTQAQPQPIETVEQMANLVMDWLQNRHAQLNHLREIPDSEKLEVADEDTGEVLVLEGDLRRTFLMGLAVAQTIFIDPPFKVAEVDDEDDEQDA